MAALGKAVRSAVSSGRHETTKGMRKTRSIGQDIAWWWKVNEVQIPGTKNALYRAFLDSLGLQTADGIIAATAVFTGTTLVTRNVRDFKKVPTLNIEAI